MNIRNTKNIKRVILLIDETEILMDDFFLIIKELFGHNEIVYISTPINTGKRFINWYNSVGKNLEENVTEFCKERTKNVVNPNVKNVKTYIERNLQIKGKVIIDPTTLENEKLQWEQKDFYRFWDRVIKDLVDEIIFLEGWEYSVGCCHEYLSAIESNIKIYKHNMKKLSFKEAKQKMVKSIDLYKSHKMDDGITIKSILYKLLNIKESM